MLVGDRSAPGGHAEIKGSHFLGNGIGLGICATGSANVADSEFRENKDGIVVIDARSDLQLTTSKLLRNRSQGLHVFANGSATVSDCDLQDNLDGALSGTRGKSAERASIALENCRFGGNRGFAAGAARESRLTLANCSFDGTDKMQIFRERGARIQQTNDEAEPEASPEPSAEEESSPAPADEAEPNDSPTPDESAAPSPEKEKSTPRPRHRRTPSRPHPPTPEDIHRFLRKLLPGGP